MARPQAKDFKATAHGHLARYKADVLGIADHGTWGKNKVHYPHILPRMHYRLNIVRGIREEFWAIQKVRRWKKHDLFHHLSSSQALAFNLFFPLVAHWPDAGDALLPALGLTGRTLKSADVEVIIDAQEGTNFDAVLDFTDGSRCVVELKFTESGFGRVGKETDRTKLPRIYAPKLSGRIDPNCLVPERFFRDYQLFRNLSWLRQGTDDTFLIVMPRAHRSLWKYAERWASQEQLGSLRGHVRVVALEDVLKDLVSRTNQMNERLATHVGELATKYLIGNVAETEAR